MSDAASLKSEAAGSVAIPPAPPERDSRGFPLTQLIVALVTAALGAIMVAQSWDRPFFVPGRGTGAMALPLVAGQVLLAASLLLAARVLLRRDATAAGKWPAGAARWRALGLLVLFVLYVLLLDRAGFLVANLLVGLACLRLLGGYAWWRAAALAVVLAGGLHLAFRAALGVELPRGLLGV